MPRSLEELLASVRRGQTRPSNIEINEIIKATTGSAAAKEAKRATALPQLVENAMNVEQLNALGLQSPQQQASEAVGRLTGARFNPIQRTGENSFATVGPEPEINLAEFIRNPALGAAKARELDSERSLTQETVKQQLDFQKRAQLERLKAKLKGKEIKDITDIDIDDRSTLFQAMVIAGEDVSISEFFPELFQGEGSTGSKKETKKEEPLNDAENAATAFLDRFKR